MNWKKLIPIIAIITLISLSNCKGPGEFVFNDKPEFELDVVKTISYEVESVTTRIEEGGNTSEISQIKAMPIIDRSAIFYGIDESGETEIFIDVLEPKQDLLPHDNIPPNTYPKLIKHIHIVHGMGYFFDSRRNIVSTQLMDGSNFIDVDNLRTSGVDVENILKMAEEMGAIIHDLGNGFVSIRMGGQTNNLNAGRVSQMNDIRDESYTVTIFNKLTKEIVGVAIYDLNDRLLFKMYAQAETNSDGDLILKATQQEVYDLDPVTNKTTIIKTTNEYSDFVIEEM